MKHLIFSTIFISVFFLTKIATAQAIGFGKKEVISLGGNSSFQLDVTTLNNDYRIGDEWGKKLISSDDLRNPIFARAARATVQVRSATGFYLGKFNGTHIVATNHHVCTNTTACNGVTLTFPLLRLQAKVSKTLGSWPEIDLALLALAPIPQSTEQTLLPIAKNFDFTASLYPGQLLLTIGFGVADNWLQQMVANQDNDCKVFSQANDFRLMGDPDSLNPSNYRAWSFSSGCDVSHGDSGSAMVDRSNGKPIGIIWTGKIPKSSKIQKSTYLNEMLKNPSEEIWTELSYAVPAMKIKEVITDLVARGSFDKTTAELLMEIVK